MFLAKDGKPAAEFNSRLEVLQEPQVRVDTTVHTTSKVNDIPCEECSNGRTLLVPEEKALKSGIIVLDGRKCTYSDVDYWYAHYKDLFVRLDEMAQKVEGCTTEWMWWIYFGREVTNAP